MNYIEPYAKEKNILQLGLFHFRKRKIKTFITEWEDKEKKCALKCCCDHGVPGAFEQDVYSACMRIWVKQKMPEQGIKLNYSDIARELQLKNPGGWTTKIKNSLKKLAQARYELTRCFFTPIDGKEKENIYFSLFSSASLFEYEKGSSKRKSESYLIFPEILRKNLKANYYQFLDMAWYRKLPEGLPRRLYEYLGKRRYHNINGQFTISEEILCRWLPIKESHTTNRRKRLERISQALVKEGFLSKYYFDKKKKMCIFTYAPNKKIRKKKVLDGVLVKKNNDKGVAKINFDSRNESQAQFDFADKSKDVNGGKNNDVYKEAFSWINAIKYFHKKRKDDLLKLPIADITESYPAIKKEYEKRTNSGTMPKPGWVYKAFKEKYIFKEDTKKIEDQKEYDQLLQKTKKLKKDRIKKEKNLNEIKQHQDEFKKTLEQQIIKRKLQSNTIEQLWEESKNEVPLDNIKKDIIAKMKFCKKLIAKFNEQGHTFRSDIASMAFAKKIADELGLE